MILDIISHILSIVLAIAAVIGWGIVWRRRLLKKGFSEFREIYSAEMKDFKDHVLELVNTFREIMNKNDERHQRTMDRIVELHTETWDSINGQMNKCQLIQASKVYNQKSDVEWKNSVDKELVKMDKEIGAIHKDVAHIKKVINHAD